jgi:hypothetical protein
MAKQTFDPKHKDKFVWKPGDIRIVKKDSKK